MAAYKHPITLEAALKEVTKGVPMEHIKS